MKGVFGRVGKALKDYVLKPAMTVAEYAALPVGTIAGSLIPGIGTAAGSAAGAGAAALAKKINELL